ncbi:MAG TPA: alpha/beta hydrolase [Solirubrobacteraceae bacterium]|jgi:pimeloyl-ACP methyl ester carboxylesterase
MGHVTTDDGVRLHVEEDGSGEAVLFIHEFAGDHRSWEPQVERFRTRYRCIAYAARGYPPSDVPPDLASYSQQRAVDDALAVLDGLGIERAHVVGLSMGGFCTLHLGLQAPERTRSLVVAGVGYGAAPEAQDSFRRESAAIAQRIRAEGPVAFAKRYAVGPARVQFQNRNRSGWELFARQLAEHSQEGAALTMLGVQSRRPSLYAMRDELAALRVPTLLLAGDEDDGCLEADLMLKRTIPSAGLVVLPKTGHTSNLEDPPAFNRAVEDFLDAVGRGAWGERDPRSQTGSITGIDQ